MTHQEVKELFRKYDDALAARGISVAQDGDTCSGPSMSLVRWLCNKGMNTSSTEAASTREPTTQTHKLLSFVEGMLYAVGELSIVDVTSADLIALSESSADPMVSAGMGEVVPVEEESNE